MWAAELNSKWLNNKDKSSSLPRSLEEEQILGSEFSGSTDIKGQVPLIFSLCLLSSGCSLLTVSWLMQLKMSCSQTTLRPEDKRELILMLCPILRGRKMSPEELAEISYVTDWSCDLCPCWALTGKGTRGPGSEKAHLRWSWTGILEPGGGMFSRQTTLSATSFQPWRSREFHTPVKLFRWLRHCRELPCCFDWSHLWTEQGVRDGTSGPAVLTGSGPSLSRSYFLFAQIGAGHMTPGMSSRTFGAPLLV